MELRPCGSGPDVLPGADMGIYDRHYGRRIPAWPANTRLTPVTKWILIANIVIFALDRLLLKGALDNFGAFTIGTAVFGGRIWEFVTFQFLHASPLHLFGNMLGLYFTGAWLERWWGSPRFLLFYLLCGIGGALFYTILVLAGALDHPLATSLVGASAGVLGILTGVAVIAPNMRVQLLFPPIEMSIRHFALGILILVSVKVLFQIGSNVGGEAGHFGGMALGFLLVKFPKLLGVGWERRRKIIRPQFNRPDSKLRPRTHVDLNAQDEIDRILDKISREGLQSLTQEERDRLRAAAENSPR